MIFEATDLHISNSRNKTDKVLISSSIYSFDTVWWKWKRMPLWRHSNALACLIVVTSDNRCMHWWLSWLEFANHWNFFPFHSAHFHKDFRSCGKVQISVSLNMMTVKYSTAWDIWQKKSQKGWKLGQISFTWKLYVISSDALWVFCFTSVIAQIDNCDFLKPQHDEGVMLLRHMVLV